MVKVSVVYATSKGWPDERKSPDSRKPGLDHMKRAACVFSVPDAIDLRAVVICVETSRGRARGVHVQLRDVHDDSGPGQATQPL